MTDSSSKSMGSNYYDDLLKNEDKKVKKILKNMIKKYENKLWKNLLAIWKNDISKVYGIVKDGRIKIKFKYGTKSTIKTWDRVKNIIIPAKNGKMDEEELLKKLCKHYEENAEPLTCEYYANFQAKQTTGKSGNSHQIINRGHCIMGTSIACVEKPDNVQRCLLHHHVLNKVKSNALVSSRSKNTDMTGIDQNLKDVSSVNDLVFTGKCSMCPTNTKLTAKNSSEIQIYADLALCNRMMIAYHLYKNNKSSTPLICLICGKITIANKGVRNMRISDYMCWDSKCKNFNTLVPQGEKKSKLSLISCSKKITPVQRHIIETIHLKIFLVNKDSVALSANFKPSEGGRIPLARIPDNAVEDMPEDHEDYEYSIRAEKRRAKQLEIVKRDPDYFQIISPSEEDDIKVKKGKSKKGKEKCIEMGSDSEDDIKVKKGESKKGKEKCIEMGSDSEDDIKVKKSAKVKSKNDTKVKKGKSKNKKVKEKHIEIDSDSEDDTKVKKGKSKNKKVKSKDDTKVKKGKKNIKVKEKHIEIDSDSEDDTKVKKGKSKNKKVKEKHIEIDSDSEDDTKVKKSAKVKSKDDTKVKKGKKNIKGGSGLKNNKYFTKDMEIISEDTYWKPDKNDLEMVTTSAFLSSPPYTILRLGKSQEDLRSLLLANINESVEECQYKARELAKLLSKVNGDMSKIYEPENDETFNHIRRFFHGRNLKSHTNIKNCIDLMKAIDKTRKDLGISTKLGNQHKFHDRTTWYLRIVEAYEKSNKECFPIADIYTFLSMGTTSIHLFCKKCGIIQRTRKSISDMEKNNTASRNMCTMCNIKKASDSKRLSTKEIIQNLSVKYGEKCDFSQIKVKFNGGGKCYIRYKVDGVKCIRHDIEFDTCYHYPKDKFIKCTECLKESMENMRAAKEKKFIEDYESKYPEEKGSIVEGSYVAGVNIEGTDRKKPATIVRRCIRNDKHKNFRHNTSNVLAGQGCPKCRTSNISKIADQWLKEQKKKRNIKNFITHESDNGEYQIGYGPKLKYGKRAHFKVDGYDPDTNTIYEFNGCYFHGHQCQPAGKKVLSGRTFGDLYLNTLVKLQILLNLGYNVVTKWECKYRAKINKKDAPKKIQKYDYGVKDLAKYVKKLARDRMRE
jgi:hypothetical protein